MNIKTKIIFSHIAVIFVITAFFCLLTLPIYNYIITKNLTYSENFFNNYYETTNKLLTSKLEPITNKYVEMKNEAVADTLSSLFQADSVKQINPFEDEKIRSLITEYIRADNIVVGYSFIFDSKCNFLLSANSLDYEINEKMLQAKFPELLNLIEQVKSKGISEGSYDFYYISPNGIPTRKIVKKFGSFRRILGTNYFIGTTIFLKNYQEAVYNHLGSEKKEILSTMENSLTILMRGELYSLWLKVIILAAIILLAFIWIGYYMAHTIASPLSDLTNFVRNISFDSFKMENEILLERNDEIGELSNAFRSLGEKISTYKNKLKKEIVDRDIMEKELEIAKEIQEASLPNFSEDYQRKEFELCAKIKPAKTIAGDLFDFFYIGKNSIVLFIADASGKGIPAAFYISKVRDFIRGFCEDSPNDPSIALKNVNRIISKNNPTFMFVTAFLCYYNYDTGEILYSNAGHHAAVKLLENGDVIEFGEICDPVLGFNDSVEYSCHKHYLEKNEAIILYTDGVTEARSEKGIFGKQRLFNLITQNHSKTMEEITTTLYDTLSSFEDQQTDDITVLSLRRCD